MESDSGPETSFKKPMLVGKIGRLPKKLQNPTTALKKAVPEEENIVESKNTDDLNVTPSPKTPETVNHIKELPYEEPDWSGLPEKEYALEVLKEGSIIETIHLTKKPFWVFGRLPNCDICMQHPTISRHHAVLQYRKEKTETSGTGFYIYDLESTHGTFLNKNRLRPRSYMKIHVGHMLKLGCSTRTYILNGPEDDAEEESELTVTELKQKRQDELRQREEKEEEMRRKQEDRGIDWGLGEDADEETDLSENPYAQTNNEELYLDNPKKALRGFFEREGLELEYDCSEQGMGQFLCKVELPVDDEMGRPVVAEVFHKGKKKEAVVQCALEACRILDRHGLLRQATHEPRKRKPKNWEENDYYDSDDDTFLDRTGSVEKKREMRMNAKLPQKAETYETLLEKERKISRSIKELEQQLAEAHRISTEENNDSKDSDVDSLDSFMMQLKNSKPSKQTVNKLKSDLNKLKQEHGQIIKLVNIAKPASLPPLVPEYAAIPSTSSSDKKGLPIFGKRKKIKVQLPVKPEIQMIDDDNEDEEMEEDEEESRNELREVEQTQNLTTNPENEERFSSEDFRIFVEEHKGNYTQQLEKIRDSLEQLTRNFHSNREQLNLLKERQNQILKLFKNNSSDDIIVKDLNNILKELNKLIEQKTSKLNKGEVNSSTNNSSTNVTKEVSEEIDERKKKRNQRRIQQKQERAEIERQKGYQEDQTKEDYNMWVPPSGQTGDGRTALNDKYGY